MIMATVLREHSSSAATPNCESNVPAQSANRSGAPEAWLEASMPRVVTFVTEPVNTFVRRRRAKIPDVLTLIAKRYRDLVEQLVEYGYARSYNDLFTRVLRQKKLVSQFNTMKSRGSSTPPGLKTLDDVAQRLGLDPLYFVDNPDYVGRLDYRTYLRSGSSYGAPAVSGVIERFLASDVGSEYDDQAREHLLAYDRAFGPITTSSAAMSVLAAHMATRAGQPAASDEGDTQVRRRAEPVVRGAASVHEPKAEYRRRSE